MIAALIAVLWGDDRLARVDPNGRPGVLVFGVLMFLMAQAGHELRTLLKAGGYRPGDLWSDLWMMTAAALLVALPGLINIFIETTEQHPAAVDYQITPLLIVVGMIGSFVSLMRRREAKGAIGHLSTSMFFIVYLGLLPSFILRIAIWAPTGGAWLLLYFIGTVKFCDIGAYFTGRYLGRHKLIAWLSPKKTIEGLAGGIVSSTVVAIVVPPLVRWLGPESLQDVFPGWQTAAMFGFFMAVFGQAGDLLASLIKRDAGAKDSANAVPGFGGVLDILDSLLPTAPIAFWLLVK